MRRIRGRRLIVAAVVVIALLIAGDVVAFVSRSESEEAEAGLPHAAKEFLESSQGEERGGAGGESFEALTAAEQFAEARTAPGIVAPGGYSAAFVRFTEGPGAGVGHVFKSTDNGGSWTDISGNFPDVPANSIAVLPSGGLVVGTDLGVVYKANNSVTWKRLGGNFPVTVAIYVKRGPDGNVYAATHGRGIWRISGSGL